jgi:hypothetical protein
MLTWAGDGPLPPRRHLAAAAARLMGSSAVPSSTDMPESAVQEARVRGGRVALKGMTPTVLAMAEVVLRIRLTGGDHMDVTYEETDTLDTADVAEHAIAVLATDAGMLRSRHGDRLVVIYGRGVAAVEVAPRGAIL